MLIYIALNGEQNQSFLEKGEEVDTTGNRWMLCQIDLRDKDVLIF